MDFGLILGEGEVMRRVFGLILSEYGPREGQIGAIVPKIGTIWGFKVGFYAIRGEIAAWDPSLGVIVAGCTCVGVGDMSCGMMVLHDTSAH